MIIKRTIIIVLFFSLPVASFALEQIEMKEQKRSFALSQHGNLILDVPITWKEAVREPQRDLTPTIIFTPNKGDEFEVHITPLWSPTNDLQFNKPVKIRSMIENDLGQMIIYAFEKNVNIQEFKGIYGEGYYFLLTDKLLIDKAPKPGEYLYIVRAGVGVGDLLLNVTILSRSKDSTGIVLTIKALQEAIQNYE